jgi:hypothetical protein
MIEYMEKESIYEKGPIIPTSQMQKLRKAQGHIATEESKGLGIKAELHSP